MKNLRVFISSFLLMFVSGVCIAADDNLLSAIPGVREEAERTLKSTVGSTADPPEQQQKLGAARLRLVQFCTSVKKEMERLSVDSASLRNKIEAAKFRLLNANVTGVGAVSSFDIGLFDQRIGDAKGRLADLQQLQDSEDKKKAIQVAQQTIAELQSFKGIRTEIDGDERRISEARDKNAAYEAALSSLENDLVRIDDAIQRVLQHNKELSFFTIIATGIFAVLVGFVILGFFVIAARSESIRTAIFTGDSGIQFVTLFSVVIAIILFGILRILEGKELAALLGGLSGYILGRATSRSPAPPGPSAPTSGQAGSKPVATQHLPA